MVMNDRISSSSKENEAGDGRYDKGQENTWSQKTDSLAVSDRHTLAIGRPKDSTQPELWGQLKMGRRKQG